MEGLVLSRRYVIATPYRSDVFPLKKVFASPPYECGRSGTPKVYRSTLEIDRILATRPLSFSGLSSLTGVTTQTREGHSTGFDGNGCLGTRHSDYLMDGRMLAGQLRSYDYHLFK
jgi:hypothetical protein